MSEAIVNGLTSGINSMGGYAFFLVLFLSSLLIGVAVPSTSASAALIFPIIAGAMQSPEQAIGAVTMYTMGLGIANMFTPVQAVVLGSMDRSGVDYRDFMKASAGFIGMQIAIAMFVIAPMATAI